MPDNRSNISFSGLYKVFRNLSLDIVAGAMAVGYMAVALTGTDPGIYWYIVLGCSVWLVYTTDHLIDTWGSSKDLQPERHRFHRKHSKALIMAIIIISMATGVTAFWLLPRPVIIFGIILGTLVLLYLFLVALVGRKEVKWFQKEFFIAMFYTAGIWGGPLAVMESQPEWSVVAVIVVVFLLAYADLLIFSLYDLETDKQAGHTSLPRQFGRKTTGRLLNGALLLATVTSIVMVIKANPPMVRGAFSILLLMTSILFLISRYPSFFGINDRYRVCGEIVFSLPFLLMLYSLPS